MENLSLNDLGMLLEILIRARQDMPLTKELKEGLPYLITFAEEAYLHRHDVVKIQEIKARLAS